MDIEYVQFLCYLKTFKLSNQENYIKIKYMKINLKYSMNLNVMLLNNT